MFRLLQERPGDLWEVESLLDLSFAPGRTALSSYSLRSGTRPVDSLCTVARDEFDSVAGCIRYWPVLIGDAAVPSLLLGPVAVHPTRQGEGLGALLILETLEIAVAEGWKRAILVGDEPYYRRFGFTRALAMAIEFPPPTNPARLLARELEPGAMQDVGGKVHRWQGPPYDIPPD